MSTKTAANLVMTALFGVSWKTSLGGYIEAVLIGITGYVGSESMPSEPAKEKIFWFGIAVAASRAVTQRFAKDHNVSNSPTPLPEGREVEPNAARVETLIKGSSSETDSLK